MVLVAVAMVVFAVSMGVVVWKQRHRAPTVSAEDFQAGRVVWHLDSLAHGEKANGLWFSDDGRSLWVGGLDARVVCWDLATWKVTAVKAEHPGYSALAWWRAEVVARSIGNRLARLDSNGELTVQDLTSPASPRLLSGRKAPTPPLGVRANPILPLPSQPTAPGWRAHASGWSASGT